MPTALLDRPVSPPTIGLAEAASRIRAALRRRSGMDWSVTVERRRYAGWLTIHVPPRRREDRWYMGEHDRKELANLLGMPLANVEVCGVDVAPCSRDRMVACAEGDTETRRNHGHGPVR